MQQSGSIQLIEGPANRLHLGSKTGLTMKIFVTQPVRGWTTGWQKVNNPQLSGTYAKHR